MKVSVNEQLVNSEEFFPWTELAFGIAICQKRNCSLKPFSKNVEDLIILQSGLTAMGQSLGQNGWCPNPPSMLSCEAKIRLEATVCQVYKKKTKPGG